jgi:hypothetical protein
MGTTLTNQIVSETYDSLLKVTDNNIITGTKKRITDGFGNDTPLLLSSTDVQIDGNFLLPGTTAQYVRGNGSLATFNAGLTSVGVSMPSAFSVTGSPLTANGTISITGAGTSAQYIDGTGALQTLPTLATADKLVTEVHNKTGATLTKGTIVYISGTQGNLPAVDKALATGDATSAQTFGLVQANISNNSSGFVVVSGKLIDLDTSAYSDGTQLYLSPTTAGTYTSTKPYAPNHLVYVGIVVRAHPTQGSIEVKIQNGYELDELHDVIAQTPNNNDGIFYNSTSTKWENKTIATALGFTPVTNARTISTTAPLSGGGDLTANRTLSITQATTSVDGYLSATDWTTFNNKVATSRTISTTAPLTGGGSLAANRTLAITQSTTTTDGYLSSTDWNTFNNKASKVNTFNRQSASYTLVLSDASKIIEMNVASANTLTIPTNASVAFPIGTEIQVLQYGVGQTTIAGAGVTLNSKSGQLKIANRYTGVTLVKVGTDEWYVIGNLSA